MSASGGTKAVVAALLANTGIAITKFVAWVLTGSASMLAEAIHSVADAGNQALLLVGGKRPSGRPPTRTRSATAASATSTPSSWRSCCSASAACSRSTRRITSSTRSRPATAAMLLESRWRYVPLVVLGRGDRDGVAVVPHRHHRDQQGARQSRVVRVHPQREGAGAPVDPAGGSRRPGRTRRRLRERRARTARRTTSTSTSSARPSSASCWSSSRSSWRSR